MIKPILSKYIFSISLLLTVYLHGEVYDGYTLFTPLDILEENATTDLINNDYELTKSDINLGTKSDH